MTTYNISSSLFNNGGLDDGRLEFTLNINMLKSTADTKKTQLGEDPDAEVGRGRRRLFAKFGTGDGKQQEQQEQKEQDTQPQRSRSLMFRPILDVAGVGALIDSITRRDEQQTDQAAGRRPRMFLGSLRRNGKANNVATTVHHLPRPVSLVPVQNEDTKTAVEDNGPVIALSLKCNRSRQFLLHTPLGEFEVERTLGQGSYGKVKLMRSALTGERLAVKIIRRYAPHKRRRGHAEWRKARTLDRRVVREANLASILGGRHPGIVPLTDFRVTDTHFYLFYAYVDGETLAERIGNSGLSENEARGVFRGVAEAVAFCHAHSVIHRDIKLENIMVTRTDGQARLIDFGLANFFDGASLMETFCGSLPYTAPEILRGDAYVGPEVDVWSLGVLLYVTLAGRFPFDDPAQPRNYDKIMAADFALRPDMSGLLRDLLTRMLEPSVARRISMADVLAHPWVGGGSNGAHGSSLLPRRCLPLPGPRVDSVAAREVAVCLDRSADEVLQTLETAMARSTLRRRGTRTIVDVPNSPVVSVYALVLHQMRRRRYYMGIPVTAPTASSTSHPSGFAGASSMPLLPLRSTALSGAAVPRVIGALDETQRRVALPAALTNCAPADVMQRLSVLLKLHEIAHAYVEPRCNPDGSAAGSATATTTATTTVTGSSWSWSLSWMDSASDLDINDKTVTESANAEPENSNTAPENQDTRRWSSRLYRMLSRSQHLGGNAGHAAIQQQQDVSPSQPEQPSTSTGQSSSTFVAVKHTTCIMLAQYSPSLSRSKEAEVLEYYSCSVRIELVRVAAGPASLRRRYAILVDRMAGHKGKYTLFRSFLQRMATEI
ncbi:Serine/threonine-protein kinase [Coemansia sp. RSA 1813]|nr:Serine/threonine-protein kinase [Coemansia sp. RSA 1646]KAJ1766251.1 Serine/threonine-protein kinase [Coemansia sp. RSA 1843]KAJ2085910.1 Serine/threonine-protein kinase [Coemansia sp. RSA 986]KAJ2214406.1 Serine/threonine-protein kinase [Coemansia sp. RSA 487]KAJ2563568.1 Serine/threonine-protein kinase [Coemansia sp. RSA 1813]